MKGVSRHWFVRCPVDKSLHFGVHPHIFHTCPRCGKDVGVNIPEDGHEYVRTEFKAKNQRDWSAKFDEVCANPEAFIVEEGTP
jgi:hypothetical protein